MLHIMLQFVEIMDLRLK